MSILIISLSILSICICISLIIGTFIMFNRINIICDKVEEISENIKTIKKKK